MTATSTVRLDSLSTAVPFGDNTERVVLETIMFTASETYPSGGYTIDASAKLGAVHGAIARYMSTGNSIKDIVADVIDYTVGSICVILKNAGSGTSALATGTALTNATGISLQVWGTSA